MTIVDIAEQLEVHPNTVRFHWEALIGDGRVERVEPGPQAPGQATDVVSRGPWNGSRRVAHCPFLELADVASAVVCPIHLGLV